VRPGRRTTTRRGEPLTSLKGPGAKRGAAATAVSAYGNRRHGSRSRTTSDEADGAVIFEAPAKSQRAGAAGSRATRRSAAAIEGADVHVKVQRLKPADACHALQSPGTTAPVTGSVRRGVA
jgi:hypothetical protein